MFTYAVKVDIGVSEEQNDDRALIESHIFTDGFVVNSSNKDYLIAAICDGVGGRSHGGQAAMITLEVLSYLNRPSVELATIRTAIEEANRRIIAAWKEDYWKKGMCTTLAGVYVDQENFFVFNAGDSRVYRFRHRYLMQLSKDHSHVQDLVTMGEITMEEAKVHSQKNLINKCIGNKNSVNPRIVDMSGDFYQGDLLLICSDGISDVITEIELKDLLLQHKQDYNLSQCCQELYELAIKNGSLDNLSLILMRKEAYIDDK